MQTFRTKLTELQEKQILKKEILKWYVEKSNKWATLPSQLGNIPSGISLHLFAKQLREERTSLQTPNVCKLIDMLQAANKRLEEEKTRADNEKIRADNEKIRADKEKIRADKEKIRADNEKMRADCEHNLAVEIAKRADEASKRADEASKGAYEFPSLGN